MWQILLLTRSAPGRLDIFCLPVLTESYDLVVVQNKYYFATETVLLTHVLYLISYTSPRNVLGMVFSMCALMLRVKWCAWVAIYCSCISFANTKYSGDTKQIMSRLEKIIFPSKSFKLEFFFLQFYAFHLLGGYVLPAKPNTIGHAILNP